MPDCWKSNVTVHLSSDNFKTFLTIIDIVILWINSVKQNISLKTVEKLHQIQWQFSSAATIFGVKLHFCFTINIYLFLFHTLHVLVSLMRYVSQSHVLAYVRERFSIFDHFFINTQRGIE